MTIEIVSEKYSEAVGAVPTDIPSIEQLVLESVGVQEESEADYQDRLWKLLVDAARS